MRVEKSTHPLAPDRPHGSPATRNLKPHPRTGILAAPDFDVLIIGPNSRVANNSIVFTIEAQVQYAIKCLEHMDHEGASAIEVKADVQTEYNRALQIRKKRTVFVSGCKNWYRDAQGRNPILGPDFAFRYWMRARHLDKDAFQGSA